jgi:hypothetical protein
MSIVVCLENIEIIVNQNKTRIRVIAVIFLKENLLSRITIKSQGYIIIDLHYQIKCSIIFLYNKLEGFV